MLPDTVFGYQIGAWNGRISPLLTWEGIGASTMFTAMKN